MTWREMAAWAVHRLHCPYCGVDAGDPCQSKNGAPLPIDRTHWKRAQPIQRVWLGGYEKGKADTIVMASAQGQSWINAQLQAQVERAS